MASPLNADVLAAMRDAAMATAQAQLKLAAACAAALGEDAPKLTKDGRKARGKRAKDPNRPAYASCSVSDSTPRRLFDGVAALVSGSLSMYITTASSQAETAYQLFMKETRATNTSLPKGKEAMVLIGEMWSKLPVGRRRPVRAFVQRHRCRTASETFT